MAQYSNRLDRVGTGDPWQWAGVDPGPCLPMHGAIGLSGPAEAGGFHSNHGTVTIMVTSEVLFCCVVDHRGPAVLALDCVVWSTRG